MHLIQNPKVETVFNNYPALIRPKLALLRQLIIDTASEMPDIKELEETLKWGEPSYLAKKGSTIRIDWKSSKPDQYAMYFKCTSKLVPTFKTLYSDTFTFEKNRAIVFKINEPIPVPQLSHCISLALSYHTWKKQTNTPLA